VTTNATLLELAQQLAGGDERMKLVSQLLSAQAERNDEDAEELANERRSREERTFRFLRRLNAELSRAAGACVCWGKRPLCSVCHGRGRAGFRAPDERLFLEYFGPLLEQLGMLRDEEDLAQGDET
jgi:hypothetical protein